VVPTVWSPKITLEGDRDTAGTVRIAPVPVRATNCGLPAALSVITSDSLRVPTMVGVNVTLRVQVAPAPTEVPQLFVCP
jgi:hypothetical protein